MELVVLLATCPGIGMGSAALLKAVMDLAKSRCGAVVLTTTNDNLAALAFYQRRGVSDCAGLSGGDGPGRRVVKAMPVMGHNGIAMRDELEIRLPA